MKFNADFDVENTKKVDVKFENAENNFNTTFAEGSAKTSVKNHDELLNRDLPNQHPISSITGLEEKFENYLKNEELSVAVDNALATAKESGLFDGKDGVDGKDGANGKDGIDGKTPVKGTDYFTETDKAEMVQAVISLLPIYDGEVVAV